MLFVATSRRCRGPTTGSACRGSGYWEEILNSDATLYGGSGQGNLGGVDASPVPMHGRPASLTITLPPLAVVAFRGPRP